MRHIRLRNDAGRGMRPVSLYMKQERGQAIVDKLLDAFGSLRFVDFPEPYDVPVWTSAG